MSNRDQKVVNDFGDEWDKYPQNSVSEKSIKNAFDLANSIEKLVNDNDLRKSFGNASRSIVLDKFSKEVVCEQTLNFYNKITL